MSDPTPADKPMLRERFRAVILMAGYTNPEPILEEWFEKYYAGDRAEFIKMLEEYEQNYARDGEII